MNSHPGPARADRSGRDGGQHDPGEQVTQHGEEPEHAPHAERAEERATLEGPPDGYELL